MSEPSRRWNILGLLVVAELLGMGLWFTASAVAPQLQELWGLERGLACARAIGIGAIIAQTS